MRLTAAPYMPIYERGAGMVYGFCNRVVIRLRAASWKEQIKTRISQEQSIFCIIVGLAGRQEGRMILVLWGRGSRVRWPEPRTVCTGYVG